MSNLFDHLFDGLFAIGVLYLVYSQILRPQLSHLFHLGWKELHKKCGINCAISHESLTLVRLAWNQYYLAVWTKPEGLYLQRFKQNRPITICIPYNQLKQIPRPLKAKLFSTDSYFFFVVNDLDLWIEKKYCQHIISNIIP